MGAGPGEPGLFPSASNSTRLAPIRFPLDRRSPTVYDSRMRKGRKRKMGKGKAEIKRFAVLDTGAVVDLETYGMGSWGSTCQYGAKVKGDKVYETYWSYGGDWEEDDVGEALLGKIVYSSDKPLRILESRSSPAAAQPGYAEYGADLGEAFGAK